MSGPVRPPLTVAESDGTPTIRPCNTIAFNSADFVVIDNGTTARIDLVPGGGGGAALTSTMIGFGDASNLLTGQNDFVFIAASTRLGLGGVPSTDVERLHIKGTGGSSGGMVRFESTETGTTDGPILDLFRNRTGAASSYLGNIRFIGKDDGDNVLNFSQLQGYMADDNAGSADSLLRIRGLRNSTDISVMDIYSYRAWVNPEQRSDVDFRVSSDNVTDMLIVDASDDSVGIGGSPDSNTARLQVTDDGTKSYTLLLESTDADADVGPTLGMWRNSPSPAAGDDLGMIYFAAENDGGSRQHFAQIWVTADDETAGTLDASMNFRVVKQDTLRNLFRIRQSEVVVNEDSVDCNFRVESDATIHMFQVDAGLSKVSVGAQVASGGAEFQVNEDASFKSYTVNQNTSGIVDASLQKNGHIVCNPSGGNITVTLGGAGGIGEKVTIMNVAGDASTVLLAVTVGDSTLTTPAAFSSGDSETWFCYKDQNWMRINSQT